MQLKTGTANFLICLYVVLMGGFLGKVIPLVTAIDREIGTTPSQSSWLISITSVAAVVIAPFVGRLTLRFTHRSLMTAGVVIGIVGSVVAALGTSFVTILIGRLIEGVAFFLTVNSAMTMMMMTNHGAARARALSFYIASLPLGVGVFSALAAQLIGHGWQAVFWLHAALLIAALAAVPLLPNPVQPRVQEAAPGVDAAPYRRLPPIFLGMAVACSGAAQFGSSAFLPTYLVQIHGMDLGQAAIIGSIGLFVGIAGNILAGFLLGRGVHPKMVVFCAMAVMGLAGLAAFAPAAGSSGNAAAYMVLLLCGGGANSGLLAFSPLVTPDPARLGQSNAILNQISNIGMLFTAPLMFIAYANIGTFGPRAVIVLAAALPVLILILSGIARLDHTEGHAEARPA